jgi:hypothetical protein
MTAAILVAGRTALGLPAGAPVHFLAQVPKVREMTHNGFVPRPAWHRFAVIVSFASIE